MKSYMISVNGDAVILSIIRGEMILQVSGGNSYCCRELTSNKATPEPTLDAIRAALNNGIYDEVVFNNLKKREIK